MTRRKNDRTQTGRPLCASLAVHFEEKRPNKALIRQISLPSERSDSMRTGSHSWDLFALSATSPKVSRVQIRLRRLLKSRVITRPLCLRALHSPKGCALSAAAASDTATATLPGCSFQQRKESITRAEKKQQKTHRCLWHLIDAKSAVAISITIVSRPR